MSSKFDSSSMLKMRPSEPLSPAQDLLDPSKVGQRLWAEAREQLQAQGIEDEKRRKLLDGDYDETPETVSLNLKTTKENVESCRGGKFDRTIDRLDIFCQTATNFMAFTPQTVQIVWTCFALLMKFLMAYKEFWETFLNALDAMSDALFICNVYISQCRLWDTTSGIADKIRQRIRNIFCWALGLSIRTVRWESKYQTYGRAGLTWKATKDYFGVKFWKAGEFTGLMENIQTQLQKLRELDAKSHKLYVENVFGKVYDTTARTAKNTDELIRSFVSATNQSEAFFKAAKDRLDQISENVKWLMKQEQERQEAKERMRYEDEKRWERKLINEKYMKKLAWLQDGTNLDVSEPEKQRQEKIEKTSAGTCQWVIRDKKFTSWLQGKQRRTLWIKGKAGSGKSFLCSSIVEHLSRLSVKGKETSIMTSFFCQVREPSKSTGSRIMLHVLLQLFWAIQRAEKAPIAPTDSGDDPEKSRLQARTLQILAEDPKGKQVANASGLDATACANIFQAVAKELTCKIFIVLDALDECVDREKSGILKTLLQVVQQTPNIYLILSSRSALDIEEIFSSTTLSPHRLKAGKVATKEDISIFLNHTLSDEYGFIPTKDREWASDTILARSDGMFQYATMALQGSNCSEVKANFNNAIRNLPEGLNQLYTERFQSMQSTARRYLEVMLRWLVCGVGHIKLISIIDEVGRCYQDKNQTYKEVPTEDFDTWMEVETRKANSIMGDLYPQVRDFIKYNEHTTVIEVQHASILDWVDISSGDPKSPTQNIGRQRGHLIMACNMMQTVTHPSFQKRFLSSNVRPDHGLRYELSYWHYHVREAERTEASIEKENPHKPKEWTALYEDIDDFMGLGNGSNPYFENWRNQASPVGFFPKEYYLSDLPLHIFAQLGLLGSFKRNFELGQNHDRKDVLSQKDAFGNLPLHLICQGIGGFVGLEYVLEKDDSQVNVLGDRFDETPLLMMLTVRCATIPTLYHVQLLLRNGAQVQIPDNFGWTCLHYAAQLGDSEICDEILQRDVEVNARNFSGITPMELVLAEWDAAGSASTSYERIAYALLNKTTDDKENLHNLFLAIEWGLPQLCDRLTHLINNTDVHGWTPLMLAEQTNDEIYKSFIKMSTKETKRMRSEELPKIPIQVPSSWSRDTEEERSMVPEEDVLMVNKTQDGPHSSWYWGVATYINANHPIPPGPGIYKFRVEIQDLTDAVL
ncbi:hypothetical protein IWZ00DRAFT_559286 [Phyllosticta capitalensis]